MATFGKFETTIVPSEFGLEFEAETGEVVKQLRNSAIIKIKETQENSDLMRRSNGVIIINYKQLQKI